MPRRLARARPGAVGALDERWAALAPSPVVIADRGQAAGVGAVHLQVCGALLRCEQAERRQWARLEELRAYRRARGRDILHAVLAQSLGVVLLILVVDGADELSPGPALLAFLAFAAPLAVQQCAAWLRRGRRARQPPAWVTVGTDGADSTALRLTEYAEQALAALDLARTEFGARSPVRPWGRAPGRGAHEGPRGPTRSGPPWGRGRTREAFRSPFVDTT